MVKVGDFVRRGKRLPMYRVTEVVPSPEPVPTARKNDPATSKGKKRVNKYELCTLEIVGRNPVTGAAGATGKEIATLSGFPLNCITPRFAPLRRKGLIKDSGVRRDKQIVWVLA